MHAHVIFVLIPLWTLKSNTLGISMFHICDTDSHFNELIFAVQSQFHMHLFFLKFFIWNKPAESLSFVSIRVARLRNSQETICHVICTQRVIYQTPLFDIKYFLCLLLVAEFFLHVSASQVYLFLVFYFPSLPEES